MKLSKTLLAAAMLFSMARTANAWNPADPKLNSNHSQTSSFDNCPLKKTGNTESRNDIKVSLGDSTKDQFNRSNSVSYGVAR